MSLLLTGKGGRRYEWIAPIDPADVVFTDLGLWPENGDQYRDCTGETHGVITHPALASAWTELPLTERSALQFNGTSSGTNHGAPPWLADLSVWSLSCWISAPRLTGHRPVFSFTAGLNNTLFYRFGGFQEPCLYLGDGCYSYFYSIAGGFDDGNPHHLATMIPSVAGWGATSSAMWQDGTSLNRHTATGSGSQATKTAFTVGRAGSYYSAAAISDLILMRGVITQAQVDWLADPSNRPVRPWRRRALPSAGVTDLGDILGRFDTPLHSAIVQGALCDWN